MIAVIGAPTFVCGGTNAYFAACAIQ
jgi:hypothetical protein